MADYLTLINTAQIWENSPGFLFIMMIATLIISLIAYQRTNKLAHRLQPIYKRTDKLYSLEKKTQLLSTLHEERMLRLKTQIEILSINFQTSYVFRFAPEHIREQLYKHKEFFSQLEQLEKLCSECEINSEQLYREAENLDEKIDIKVYEHLLSRASMLRDNAQKQLEITKFIKSKLRLDKYT